MLDVGNSAVKWATLSAGGLSPQQSLLYQRENFSQVLEQLALTIRDNLKAVWISNVVGAEIAELLTQWIRAKWDISPIFAKSVEKSTGITNGYIIPAQLGVDRWLALLAARQLAEGQLSIADCGTAVTLDILSAENQHLGGLIMPGLGLMQHSLRTNAHALKPFAENFQLPTESMVTLARDTATAVVLGTHYAVVGWLEYTLSALDKQYGYSRLLLTGGNASALPHLLSRPCQQVPNLVLQGLVVLANNS